MLAWLTTCMHGSLATPKHASTDLHHGGRATDHKAAKCRILRPAPSWPSPETLRGRASVRANASGREAAQSRPTSTPHHHHPRSLHHHSPPEISSHHGHRGVHVVLLRSHLILRPYVCRHAEPPSTIQQADICHLTGLTPRRPRRSPRRTLPQRRLPRRRPLRPRRSSRRLRRLRRMTRTTSPRT